MNASGREDCAKFCGVDDETGIPKVVDEDSQIHWVRAISYIHPQRVYHIYFVRLYFSQCIMYDGATQTDLSQQTRLELYVEFLFSLEIYQLGPQ